MIRTIGDFAEIWRFEAEGTARLLGALTDASLSRAVNGEERTLGRLAWHIVGSPREMLERTGLEVFGPGPLEPPPSTARAIAEAYAKAQASALEQVQGRWTDETLLVEDDMYGEKWPRGKTLLVLVTHQTHHRGQMTVLMRQAALPVHGVYGPAREEWAQIGLAPPLV